MYVIKTFKGYAGKFEDALFTSNLEDAFIFKTLDLAKCQSMIWTPKWGHLTDAEIYKITLIKGSLWICGNPVS